MNAPEVDVEELLRRLDAVEGRLERHSSHRPPGGLTDPDEPSGERWEWGQVWAHLAEFVPYWMAQMRLVLDGKGKDPTPFGRVKTDSGRIDAIERDRARPTAELWRRLEVGLGEFRRFLRTLPPEAWSKEGSHPTLGTMGMDRMADRFVVAHLEEHADQLDGLTARHA